MADNSTTPVEATSPIDFANPFGGNSPSEAAPVAEPTSEPAAPVQEAPVGEPPAGEPQGTDPEVSEAVDPRVEVLREMGLLEKDGAYYFIDEELEGGRKLTYRGQTLQEAAELARKGLREKERHIARLEQRMRQAEELARKHQEEAGLLSKYTNPDAIKKARIQQFVGEIEPNFSEISTIDDLATDEDRERYIDVLSEAKARQKAEEADWQRQEMTQREYEQQREQKATEFFKNTMTSSFFETRNSEEVSAAVMFLTAPTSVKRSDGQPINRSEVAFHLVKEFGDDVAEAYLQGQKTLFWKEYTGRAPQRPAETRFERPAPPPAAPASESMPPPVNADERLRQGALARHGALQNKMVR
jgi:hypothetical protein